MNYKLLVLAMEIVAFIASIIMADGKGECVVGALFLFNFITIIVYLILLSICLIGM